jgi:D-alanyl-D-alanine carboxypeptidase/D-alanyl-D-alanine-endopeptidase (penicillin-binding protein 4)
VDGRVEGDLVLIGAGDPSLSDRYWESGTAALAALADSVAATGVRRVAGSLLVDVSAWDSTTVLPTREVADLAVEAGATGGAFAIDEGEIRVIARAASEIGAAAALEWSPRGREGYVRARVDTAPPDSAARVLAHYLPETRQLVLDGAVGLGVTDTFTVAQRDPVRLATTELARLLEHAGVKLARGWDVRWSVGEPVGTACVAGFVTDCVGARRIALLESPPLADVVAGMLGSSQNWIAEQLTLALGAEVGAAGSWSEGLRVVEEFLWREVGVDSLDVAPRDGSGLSAYNLVTPRALAQVLRYMAARPDAAVFRSAMAEPGEEASTLEERLAGLEGRVFAKTGTISNVNALSGYLVRESGQEVIFSILSNGAGLGAAPVRATIDEIVRILAR